jgi:S1-C subfamily serine protease
LNRLIATAWLAAALLVGRRGHALSLQEIVESTQPCVAHLGIVDHNGDELGHGSGFVVSSDGRIVTNFHVIDEATRMVAVFGGGKKVDVVGVWAADKAQDLAVLQLAAGSYPTVALSSAVPKQGDPVTVIGSPLGLAGSVSTGIVSAIRSDGAVTVADHDEHPGARSWELQISAPVSPGSSGSPVLDNDGKVIGVAVGVYGSALGGQALNFAVPVAKVRDLLASIRTGDRPRSLDAVAGRRTVTTNLIISGVGLVAIVVVWQVGWWLNKRKVREAMRPGVRRPG